MYSIYLKSLNISHNTEKEFLLLSDGSEPEICFVELDGTLVRCQSILTGKSKLYHTFLGDLRHLKYVAISPDRSIICLQSNGTTIEVLRLPQASETIQESDHKEKLVDGLNDKYANDNSSRDNMMVIDVSNTNPTNKLLGFFWLNPALFVVVSNSGFETFMVINDNDGPILKKDKSFQAYINYFLYDPTVRVLLLVSGAQNNHFQPWYITLTSPTAVKLPPFEVDLYASDLALSKSDVYLQQIYNSLFCICVNVKNKRMSLFKICESRSFLLLSIELLSFGPNHLSFVDNVIIVHNLQERMSYIFDIALIQAEHSLIEFPIAAPLPMVIMCPTPEKSDDNMDCNLDCNEELKNGSLSGGDGLRVIDSDFEFCLPGMMLDKTSSSIYIMKINCKAIVKSLRDPKKQVKFLIRRTNVKSLLHGVIRKLIEGREHLEAIRAIFDIIADAMACYIQFRLRQSKYDMNSSGDANSMSGRCPLMALSKLDAHNAAIGSSWTKMRAKQYFSIFWENHEGVISSKLPKGQGYYGATDEQGEIWHIFCCKREIKTNCKRNVISQNEMCGHVFIPCRGSHRISSQFMNVVLFSYIGALHKYHLEVEPFIYEMIINIQMQASYPFQLHQLLCCQVIQDDLLIACQLLAMDVLYPPAFQYGLDMLVRLGKNTLVIEALLAVNKVMEAIAFFKGVMGQLSKEQIHKWFPRLLDKARRLDQRIFNLTLLFFKGQGLLNVGPCEEYEGCDVKVTVIKD